MRRIEKKCSVGKGWLIVVLVVAALLAAERYGHAETFMCSSNPDYFSKRCTIHPYAITKVTDGQVEKGHLVGCQFKSFSCLKLEGSYQCRDNYGAAVIPFDFSMNELPKFCDLLCNNPSCTTGWGK